MSVAVAPPYPVDKDKTFWIALVASIAIHVIVLIPFSKGLIPQEWFEAQEQPAYVEPLEFELVSPPAEPTPTEDQSRYLSTVNSAASDNVDTPEESDLPHSEGKIPIVDNPSPAEGAEARGQSDVPPLPEQSQSLSEALERSKMVTQSTPSPEPMLPAEVPEFENTGSVRASFGGISINTTAWDFAPYLLDLKHRIKQHWIPPIAFTALGAISGYTVINFRIYPDGTMEALSVIETHGHDSLHRASANAIKGAAPFRDLPEDFPEEYLEITFGFYYLLPGDEERFFKDRRK